MISIIGAGICGLSIGWYLAKAGKKVQIFDQGKAGQKASWASAGMLASNIESEPGEEKLLPLLLESRSLWGEFAKALEKDSSIPISISANGTLAVALNSDDKKIIEHAFEYKKSLGLDLELLSGKEVRKIEPHLSPKVCLGMYSLSDSFIDSRLVLKALKIAFSNAGGRLHENSKIEEVLIKNGGVKGVISNGKKISSSFVVIAAGAWSGKIKGILEKIQLPVRPVKGQMLLVRMQKSNLFLKHAVWSPRVYLVPKPDLGLYIGATVEEKNFDDKITAGGMHDLLRFSCELLPGIYDLEITEMSSGLRPTSRDDAPILGPLKFDNKIIEGLTVATGHHRNGILLAPITAKSISHYILEGELLKCIEPFGFDRFLQNT